MCEDRDPFKVPETFETGPLDSFSGLRKSLCVRNVPMSTNPFTVGDDTDGKIRSWGECSALMEKPVDPWERFGRSTGSMIPQCVDGRRARPRGMSEGLRKVCRGGATGCS